MVEWGMDWGTRGINLLQFGCYRISRTLTSEKTSKALVHELHSSDVVSLTLQPNGYRNKAPNRPNRPSKCLDCSNFGYLNRP